MKKELGVLLTCLILLGGCSSGQSLEEKNTEKTEERNRKEQAKIMEKRKYDKREC